VKEEILSEEIPIPYKTINNDNPKLKHGLKRSVREGSEGKKEKIYKVVKEDGKEVRRTLVKESVALNPVDKVVEHGTMLSHKTSRGDFLRYDKVLNMRATAYTASFADTGKHPGHPEFGITYTGVKARKGIIAVDPRVIPLGTKVYVEVAGDIPDYGYAVAADIGSAIKGDLIDLYFDSQSFVNKWGCKRVKVYILSE
jgi:3D (Asp-Asp-Asp) domain-containing protein